MLHCFALLSFSYEFASYRLLQGHCEISHSCKISWCCEISQPVNFRTYENLQVANFHNLRNFARLRNFWILPYVAETKQKPTKISQEKLNKDAGKLKMS